MTRDDDLGWTEALAGRGQDPEAEALRAALLARTAAESVAVADRDPRREEELIARARRAGLVRAPRWRGVLALAGLAAAVFLVVLVLRPPDGRHETVRSGPDGIVRLQASDPAAEQQQIVRELRAAGVDATAYERLGMRGIDADVPQPLPPDIARVLRRHRIPPPVDGVLRVEISGTER